QVIVRGAHRVVVDAQSAGQRPNGRQFFISLERARGNLESDLVYQLITNCYFAVSVNRDLHGSNGALPTPFITLDSFSLEAARSLRRLDSGNGGGEESSSSSAIYPPALA